MGLLPSLLVCMAILIDGKVGAFHPLLASPVKKPFEAVLSSVPVAVEEATKSLSSSSSSVEDDFEFIRNFTHRAIHERGTKNGLEALRILSEKSQQRLPYPFLLFTERDDPPHPAGRPGGGDSVVQRIRKLLPSNTTNAFLQQVHELESRGFISTNPDSVDGLPSLHLNLVSNGKPVVGASAVATKTNRDFHTGLQRLLSLVHDPIYTVLLPQVRELLQDPSIQVSDIFLRRYGQDVCQCSRRGISAHYDVFSRVTSVIALDDTAADGRNGLFTTLLSNDGATSNHAALRRFFPLECGDGVVHTWDILHGVDVEPHLDRTSLIIWFTQDSTTTRDQPKMISPWLLEGRTRYGSKKRDDVADFVLASALSSVGESGLDPKSLEQELMSYPSETELYLESAGQGNTFALTRVGSLIEEGGIDPVYLPKAASALQRLSDHSTLPMPLTRNVRRGEAMGMAMHFWYEGAIRGNPLAQRALADELMLRASTNDDDDEDMRILAAVLFALAAQQGDEEASNALSRVVEFDLAARNVQDDEGFHASPIVQIAQAALSAC